MDATLATNRAAAVPVLDLGFARLHGLFPAVLLARAQVVAVAGRVPFPPLAQIGLPEFTALDSPAMVGITYGDTIFINHRHLTESICCHELVHVVQWAWLGVDRFLLCYAAGLLRSDYADSPLEKMAYSLQSDFDADLLTACPVDRIQREADAVWNGLSSWLA